MKCEYCNKEFNLKNNLTRHLKTAKFCLKLQEEEKEKENEKLEEEKEKIIKENSELLINKNIQLQVQVGELNGKIEAYKQLIESYEKFVEIPKTTTITNNNTTTTTTNNNNKYLYLTPLSITQEHIKKQLLTHFDKNHLADGQKGIAKFVNVYLLRDENGNATLALSDSSRNIFVLKNKDGQIVKDIEVINLTNLIYEPIREYSEDMLKIILEETADDDVVKVYKQAMINIRDMKDNNGDFVTHLKKEISIKTIKAKFDRETYFEDTFQTQDKHFNFLELIDEIEHVFTTKEELETVFKNLSIYYTLKY